MTIVYHYTDPGGMFGIIQNRQLWATDLRFLNDVSELEYGLVLARRTIEAKAATVSVQRQKRLLSVVSQALDLTGSGPLSEPRYAVSFAGHGDLITQWRMYAALGYGYALGFDLDQISRISKCEAAAYDVGQIQRRLERVLSDLLELDSASPLEGKARGGAGRSAAQQCIDIALFAKHPAFADEREVRLVVATKPPEYRIRGSEVIPYVGLDISDPDTNQVRGLREVIAGPLASDRAVAGVTEMLRSTGHPDVRVLRSTVPYRG